LRMSREESSMINESATMMSEVESSKEVPFLTMNVEERIWPIV
jgi:hypothetical protein